MRCAMGLAVMVLALSPRWAQAHPLDEVVQGAYLTLAPGAVRLELDLSPGANVAGALLQALDANADRVITDTEAQRYAQRVLGQSSLTLDGVAVAWTLEDISVPPYRGLEAGGGTITIRAVAERADGPGSHVLSYRNDYQPVASLRAANVFLQPGTGWLYRITAQQRSDDGVQLTVTYAATRS